MRTVHLVVAIANPSGLFEDPDMYVACVEETEAAADRRRRELDALANGFSHTIMSVGTGTVLTGVDWTLFRYPPRLEAPEPACTE